MAANTELDPGSGGDTIRTIDRTTAKTEVVGLDLTPGGGSETLMNGVMPVSDNGGSLTVDGTVTATTGLTTADLDLGAGTDTRAVAGLVYAASGGAVNVTTTTGLPVAAQGSFPVVLLASTASIGKLAANSGVDIGDVDVTSSALPTGAATSAKQPALGTAGTPSADVISVQGVASMTALKVDGSGVTQPISGNVTNAGTFAVQPTANATVDVNRIAGTATDVNSGNKSAGTQRVVLATDQPALTNALKVDGSAVTQPVSGTVTANLGTAAVTNAGTFAVQIAANSSVNQAQVAGTATSVNSGNKDAGTQRVILATDQPALSTPMPVSGTVTTNPAASAAATGYSKSHLVTAASTNATNVKASAGKLHGWYIYNSNAAARKVALHNTAGTPTAGASVTDSIVVPPTSAANAFTDVGIAFSTGIAFTTVTGLADSDNTGVGANDLVINLYFI